jgi:hypothetical protein
MKNFGAKWLALAAVAGAAAGMALNGCSSGGGGSNGGTGGSSSGGKGGSSAGMAGSGATAGKGGSSSTAGTGGSTSTAGTGGSTSTAGTGGGTAGAGGTGGGAGTGDGLPCPGIGTFTATNDVQGFALNTFMDSTAGAAVNLADVEAGTKAMAAWDGTDGDPTAGSIKVDAPFSDYKQFVDVQHNFGPTMLKSWTGFKMHVRVKVELGAGYPSASNPLGIQPYVNTGAGYNGFCSAYQNLKTTPGWNDYVLDFSTCTAPADPSMVVAYGVSFQTGSGSDGDAGITTTKPVASTVHVDSFWLENSCGGGTAGAGGTGGTAGGAGGTAGGTGGTAGGAGGTAGGAGGTAGGAGGTAGGAGGTAGGAGGTAGDAGGTTGGAGGTAGGTGGAVGGTGGGAAGTGGGTAGTGGAATTTLYDFESGVQSWSTSSSGAAVAASTEQHFDGAQSLKMTYGALDNINVVASVSGPALWPGTVLTFHAYLPTGFDTTGGAYFQGITQADNYKIFDSAGNAAHNPTPGAWNTWTYTVPNTFPGGLQVLGFQLGDNSGGSTIPAGSIYLDAITATGGTQNCAVAVGTGAHTFEAALDANVYKKDGSDADTVASQSTDRANMGTGSWKVAFTALPVPAAGATTSRRVYIAGPNIYCGQMATVHVYLPAGSDGMTFQVFAQYNNYGKNSFTGPATVTRGAWNTYAFTVPSDVGPGGIQQLGVQFLWSGTTTFTGNVYIDDVTW